MSAARRGRWPLRLLFALFAIAGLSALPATLLAQPRGRAAAPRSWSLETSLTSIYDSNLGHQVDANDAYGVVAGAGVRWRNDPEDPSLEAEYEAALHSYSEGSQWDRVSHFARAGWEGELSRRWSLEIEGEGSLGGSSEDRELADEVVLAPRISFEPVGSTRLRLTTAYRQKWFEDSSRDAFNPYVELELRQRLPGRWEVEGGSRYEVREAEDPENSYHRWTHGIATGGRLGEDDALRLEVKYRYRRYTDRLVEIEVEDGPDFETLRRDRDWWIASAVWSHDLFAGIALEVGYKFETRSSNDPDKEFDAHLVRVGTRARW